jgi:alpha-methylacyl-CoA racemase
MTGWGQSGPLAAAAGHDINYIALSGALHAIGRRGGKPTPPLNLVGDFGGGGMLLAFGIACALLEAQRSGKGQVVDAAMVDGALALMAMFIGMQHRGLSVDRPGEHLLSGAAHYYDTYETSDGKYVAVGALEPQFYAELIHKAGLDPAVFGDAGMFGKKGRDPEVWAALKPRIAEVFRQRTRDQWCSILEGVDACFAPVLTLSEAPQHPHHRARKAFLDVAGSPQNAPAPRFSRTTADAPTPAVSDRGALEALLSKWGCTSAAVGRVLGAAQF